MTYYYTTFGLNIQSEIELPELLPSTNDKVDVEIKIGQVPSELTNCLKKGVTYEIGTNDFLFEIFDVGRFYISEGKNIIISPKEKRKPDDVRLFLLGTCLGAILHQRQILPLHASAIVHRGEAVLFMGTTGAGKSTMATAFRLKGYEMITDDVCPVKIIDGKPYAIPAYPQSKLCEDAMENLGIKVDKHKLVREGIGKRAVRYQEGFATEPIKIKACYMLTSETDIASIELIQMEDSDKFIALKSNIYRPHIPNGMNLQFHLLSTISQIANQSKVKVLKKSKSSKVEQTVALVGQDLENT